MDPDLELLEAVSGGNEDALKALMRRHEEAVHRFAFRYLKNAADAAEITEETFVRVYFKAAGFKPKAKVATWIYAIALNLCRDYARKRQRRRNISLQGGSEEDQAQPLIEQIPSSQNASWEEVERRERIEIVRRCIDLLPHKLKTVLILFSLEGKSYRECATLLNCTLKTVETRLYRAKKALQRRVEKQF